MKNKILLIAIAGMVVLVGGYFLLAAKPGNQVRPKPQLGEEQSRTDEQKDMESTNPETQPAEESTPTEEALEIATYTMEEISLHNSIEDCWLLINGKIYDVTGFDTKHPGGRAVLAGCGIDSTELYETRPMGSGTPHSDKARTGLEKFYIGDLQ